MADAPRPSTAKMSALAAAKSERQRAIIHQFGGALGLGEDDPFWLYLPPLVLSGDVALQAKKAADRLHALQNELLNRLAPLVPLLGLSVFGSLLTIWLLMVACIAPWHEGRLSGTVSDTVPVIPNYLVIVVAGATFTALTTYTAWWLRGRIQKNR